MSYKCIAPGVYRDSRTQNLYERPTIDGRKTWRKLHSANIRHAKTELAARRTDQARANQGLAKDPYAPAEKVIGVLMVEYLKAKCPDRRHQPRAGKSLADEVYRIEQLRGFWSKRFPDQIKPRDCTLYYAWRRKRLIRGNGGAAVDMELGTLSNILRWGVMTGRTENNHLAVGRPKFRPKAVRHCRDFMPLDGNELHALAAALFEVGPADRSEQWQFRRSSEALGWQLLLEAMTGCRTNEVLRLRWDAVHRGQPGFIENEWLWIVRSKGGVKPFVSIHPALADCLAALKRWHLWRYQASPWFLPSEVDIQRPVKPCSLTDALRRIAPMISGAHRTSHGLRAYYVTVRRSQGISDAQIADEIGDKSGASIIVSTYGSVPPNWRGSEALGWMPTKGEPAWTVLKMPENVIHVNGVCDGVCSTWNNS